MADSFGERLRAGVLVCDGAMGTMLYAGGIALDRTPGETNLKQPEHVRAIHSAYITAGADIIQTNSYGASRLRLGPHGLERQVVEINQAAVRIAREARELTQSKVLIAGSVGPASSAIRPYGISSTELRGALREQIEALAAAGVDLLVLETFGELSELCEAATIAKTTGLPTIAQLTFGEDRRTLAGDRASECASALEELGVAVIGANCTLGPQGILEAITELAAHTTLPLAAQPNAGLPALVDGAFHYPASGEYFARFVTEFAALGVAVVGGCCGTTPDHIRAMASVARTLKPTRVAAVARPAPPAAPQDDPVGSIATRIRTRRFFVACQLDPGEDIDRALAEAEVLREHQVAAIAVGPSRRAHLRLSPISFAVLARQRLGLDAIISATTWGMSTASMTAAMLGAHALGIRTVTCERGTPPPRGDYPQVSALGDLDELGFIRLLSALNDGRDAGGVPIGRPTSFTIGAIVTPGDEWLTSEIAHARQAVEAGAMFFVTRPTFDVTSAKRLIDALPVGVPVLLTVMPLHGLAHAEFVRNELADVHLPDAVLATLRAAGDRGAQAGLEMARDLVLELRDRVDGILLRSATGSAAETAKLLQVLPG